MVTMECLILDSWIFSRHTLHLSRERDLSKDISDFGSYARKESQRHRHRQALSRVPTIEVRHERHSSTQLGIDCHTRRSATKASSSIMKAILAQSGDTEARL